MGEFSYMPLRGPLSGASFEAQTTAFFEKLALRVQDRLEQFNGIVQSLQLRVDTLSVRVDKNTAAIDELQTGLATLRQTVIQLGNDLASLTLYAQATRQMLTAMQADLAAIKTKQAEQDTALTSHEARLAALERASLPDGFIGLMDGGDLPEAWRECNGTNGAPDLSGYAASPIRYIQKQLAGA